MRSVLICALGFGLVGTAWSEVGVFDVRPDLRDPFAFLRQIDIPPPPPPKIDFDGIARAKADARELLEAGEFAKAREACKFGLELIALSENIQVPELSDRREELLRLHAVAERMLRRREAEDAFRALNLRLNGIVSSERVSQALINGVTLARGDFVVLAGERTEAQIEEIRKDEIVLRFRGMLMPLKLQ